MSQVIRGGNHQYEIDECLAEPEGSYKESKREGANMVDTKTPHILLIDDDPLFRNKVRRIAKQRNISITVCGSLHEVTTMSHPRLFDIAIVDYFLDDIKDYLRGTDIAPLFETTPVLLISNTDQAADRTSSLPTSVRTFLNKGVGINTILDKALEVANPAGFAKGE